MLAQNYPNPTIPTSTIRYAIPQDALVQFRVSEAPGRVVAELKNGMKEAGAHSVTFDAPRGLPRSLNLYRCDAGGTVLTGEMSLKKQHE